MLSSFLLPLLALAGSALAELQIVRPGTASWWVANSQNTVQWVGLDPAIFAISVFNSNITLLSSGSAVIQTQNNAYDLSFTLTPFLNVGTGYTIKLHNTTDPTDVFATSEPFEVRPQGTAYPPVISTLPSTSSASPSSTAGSNSASTTGAAAAAATTGSTSGAEPRFGKTALRIVQAGAVVWGLERWLL
ncbi:hypothetical protein BDY24DRAFT_385514 [Mrakia frigida]|uniref:uncharacterized protein n=1 Tax=Mrakia frigida TaxID=29902 RepID=UPI003FCC1A12